MRVRGPGRTRRARVVVGVALLVVAASFRLVGIAHPATTVWDERYYVFDAAAYLGGGFGIPIGTPPQVRIADEGTWVHPPLGKWLIALLGEGPFGASPFGTRFPSVLFGIAGVLLLYLLGLALWDSVPWAGLAGLLLAVDGLHIVQSRLAMLDIFATTFVTAGVLLIVLDRRRRERGYPPQAGTIERWFGSWELAGAGTCLGAAVASKWTGMLGLAFGAGLTAVWGTQARRVGSPGRTWRRISASFVLMPALVYVVSYGAFWYQHGPNVPAFARLQVAMLREQADHPEHQPENSAPASWPLLTHPIRYYAAPGGTTPADPADAGEILLLGNPVLFWGFLALAPLWLIGVVRRPTWQDAVALGGYLTLYLPWFLVGRTQFLYYLLPAVPFMCLGVAAALRRMGRSAPAAGVAFAIAATAAAMAFAPLWMGISAPWIDRLRWLASWR